MSHKQPVRVSNNGALNCYSPAVQRLDYATQRRLIKQSGRWYGRVAAENGVEGEEWRVESGGSRE